MRFSDIFTFARLGLSARLCVNEPDVRVKPVQIDGGPDSPYSVTLFVEDGNILGVAVNDTAEFALAANVGETWDDGASLAVFSLPKQPEYVPDTLDGSPVIGGWTVTRRRDGKSWDFRSLTTILGALNAGTFGIQLFSPEDLYDEAVQARYEREWLDEPQCPQETCFGCPDPDVCASLRTAETDYAPSLNGEPLGWAAPELS